MKHSALTVFTGACRAQHCLYATRCVVSLFFFPLTRGCRWPSNRLSVASQLARRGASLVGGVGVSRNGQSTLRKESVKTFSSRSRDIDVVESRSIAKRKLQLEAVARSAKSQRSAARVVRNRADKMSRTNTQIFGD